MSESPHPPLGIAYRNKSCVAMETMPNNKCYFKANFTSRLVQYIDLTRYSTLIDANQAWFSLTGYMACAKATSNDHSTIEIRFGNGREFYEKYPPHGNHPFLLIFSFIIVFSLVMKSKESWQLFRNDSFIPIGARSVRISITVTKGDSSACCAIDDVSFYILQNSGTNIPSI